MQPTLTFRALVPGGGSTGVEGGDGWDSAVSTTSGDAGRDVEGAWAVDVSEDAVRGAADAVVATAAAVGASLAQPAMDATERSKLAVCRSGERNGDMRRRYVSPFWL